MAISPPSDILLDVANAADPLKVRAATARLAALAADPTAANGEFVAAMKAARNTPGSSAVVSSTAARQPAALVNAAATSGGVQGASGHGKPSVYTKFEAVLLTQFVESMLPKESELFGDKNSAGAYRSMMAEQLATQIANAGGIGIAKAIEHAHPGTPQAAPDRSQTRGA